MVPAPDPTPWPSLGPQLVDFLEDRCVHGPGDLRGRPLRLDAEARALLQRAYEVHPPGHPRAGRRRFRRAAWSLRKGVAKTEKAAAIAFCELHPEAPVRCDGFDADGRPVGRPVVDPYIPMIAYTEKQTAELAYGALLVMVTEGPDADLFDAGAERVVRLGERGQAAGKAEPLSSSPDSRDGARTTFQHYDETHRFVLPRLVEAHETMQQNLPKRVMADAWALETTTTYAPGEGSVAQATHEEAEQIAAGKAKDPAFFFFHREAAPREGEDLDDGAQLAAAITEASGPSVMAWAGAEVQVEAIASLYRQAKRRGNAGYFERVWLNRRVQGARKAFDAARWADLAREHPVPDGAAVTLGLDGSKWQDTTAIVATDVAAGHQWLAGLWDPALLQDGEVDTAEVEAAVDVLFERFDVRRLYGDPAQGYESVLARLSSRHGPNRVAEFWTNAHGLLRTAWAMRSYAGAMAAGEVSHDGDETLARHVGAAHKKDLHQRDEDGAPLWVIEKERRDSPFKIDAAMAGALSWKARLDVLGAGWKPAAPAAPEYAFATW